MSVNPLDLSGRTILVTGASAGIGQDTAVLLSQLNARLILVARNKERLERTLSMLEAGDHRVEVFDLNALDAITPWMKDLASRCGVLHGLVHSAGVYSVIPLRILSVPQLEETLRVNLSSALMLAKGLRQKSCHAERSSLVLVSSVSGLCGQAGMSAYAASKAALIGVAKALAMELVRDGVRVNCVAPGLVQTETSTQVVAQAGGGDTMESMHPLGIGLPRDVANGIAFLLSDAARWITGTTLVIDGGCTAH